MKLRSVLAAAVVTVGLIVAPAAAASAACDEAPVPAMPHRGITGKILSPPENPPAQVGPGVTYFEVYGPSGQFFTQQSGCLQAVGDALTGGAATAGQEATSGQTFANWIMLAPEWGTAATASLADTAFDTGGWLATLDPIWDTVNNALKASITKPFMPILAIVVLLLLGWAILRGRISAFVGMLGVTLVAASMLVVTPSTLGSAADDVIVSTSTSIRDSMNNATSTDPGVAMVGGLSDRIIYDSWCAGMLGSSDSITATRYCPKLYDATHLTWVESAQAEQDPDVLADIVEKKQDEWKDAVSDLKDEDPDAYRNVEGDNGSNRVGQALNAAVVWTVSTPILFVSLVLMVAAFLLIRVIVSFLQILALIAVVQAARSLAGGRLNATILKTVAATFGAAVINSIAFSAIASATALVCTFIMGNDQIPYPIRLLVCLAFTVVVWISTKPFRKLTRMVSNWDPTQEFGKLGDKIANSIKSVAQTAVGAAAGIKLSGAKDQDEEDGENYNRGEREPRTYRQYTPRPDVPSAETHALPPGRAQQPDPVNVGDVSNPAAAVNGPTVLELDAPPTTTQLPGRRAGESDIVIVRRPEPTDAPPVNDWPGPITIDGVTIHDQQSRDPRIRDLREFEPDSSEGTYVVFDPDHGLVEVRGELGQGDSDA